MLLQRNSTLASTQIDNEVVLMCPHSGKYYTLDGSAQRIWELLSEPLAPEDLYIVLMREYAVDAETCRHDTDIFLSDMRKKALIHSMDEK